MISTYKFAMVDPYFAFECRGFFVGNVQYTTGRQHKYIFFTPSHLKIPKVATYWN
jgi:hypothetical protein